MTYIILSPYNGSIINQKFHVVSRYGHLVYVDEDTQLRDDEKRITVFSNCCDKGNYSIDSIKNYMKTCSDEKLKQIRNESPLLQCFASKEIKKRKLAGVV